MYYMDSTKYTNVTVARAGYAQLQEARAGLEMDTGERLSLGAVVSRLAGAWLANRDRPLQATQ